MLCRLLSRKVDRRIEGEHGLGHDCRTACDHESCLVAQRWVNGFEEDAPDTGDLHEARRNLPAGQHLEAGHRQSAPGVEAVAERSGWKVVKVYEDAGVGGAKGRDQRPGLDAMMKAVNAKEFDMVASWSVDRLGRSLTDLLSILQSLHEKGVGLFLHEQGLDTSTTTGKAMFQMLGVFAEFERGIIRERVNAGLARARANGTKLGRRRIKPSVEKRILELRAEGDGIQLGVGTSVVQRVFKQEA
jgi:DNA invertase Pin-like site-specific DNA recombinase